MGVCARQLDDLGLRATHVGAWRALLGGACFAVHAALTSDRTRRRGRGPESPRPPGASPFAALRRQWTAVAGLAVIGVVVFYSAVPLAVDAGGLSLAYGLL